MRSCGVNRREQWGSASLSHGVFVPEEWASRQEELVKEILNQQKRMLRLLDGSAFDVSDAIPEECGRPLPPPATLLLPRPASKNVTELHSNDAEECSFLSGSDNTEERDDYTATNVSVQGNVRNSSGAPTMQSESPSAACQCVNPGCTRPSWNGEPGEACCPMCGPNGGRLHGEACGTTFRGCRSLQTITDWTAANSVAASDKSLVDSERRDSVSSFLSIPSWSKAGPAHVLTMVASMLQRTCGESSASPSKFRLPGALLINQWCAHRDSRRHETISGRKSEFLFTVLIVCQNICTGWQVQLHAETGRAPGWGRAVNTSFAILFLFELSFRSCSFRCRQFFASGWNVLDTIVVLCIFAEEVIIRSGRKPAACSALRMLRIIRVVGALRFTRVLDNIREGRLLVLSLVRSLRMFAWVSVLACMMAYVVAIFLAHGALSRCSGANLAIKKSLLCKRFGTLWDSFASIYQAMLGAVSWGTLVDALRDLDVEYTIVCVAFFTFIMTLFFYVVIGLLVWQVKSTARIEAEDIFVRDQMERNQRLIGKIHLFFRTLDINESGAVTRAELRDAFLDKDRAALLASLEIDGAAAHALFDLLDHDDSGQVDIKEFIFGCLKYRGKARALEVGQLQKQADKIYSAVRHMEGQIQNMSMNLDRDPERKARSGTPTYTGSVQSQQSLNRSKGSSRKKTMTQILRREPARSEGIRFSEYKSFVSGNLSRKKIERTEMRAMLLDELVQIRTWIQGSCSTDGWIDPQSGKQLEPSHVNLYHFNFHVICPLTSSSSMTLLGLSTGSYQKDQLLKQFDSNGVLIAQGTMQENGQGPESPVTLHKGQFRAVDPSGSIVGSCFLDEQNCGVPREVLNKGSISYKELVSATPTKPDWFCCHWWGEPIFDFIECCQEHASKRNLKRGNDAYWICGYANRQHDVGKDISEDPENSSFRKSQRLAQGVLLILDPTAMPFQRIWCDFEIFKTVCDAKKMLDIVTKRGKPHLLTEKPIAGEKAVDKNLRERNFPVTILAKGLQVQLQNGDASVPQDKVNILNSMGKDPITGLVDQDLLRANVERANRALRGYMALAAWPQALRQGLVRKFGQATLNLAEVLEEDDSRTDLEFSLGGLEEVTDAEVVSIAQSLPPMLASLRLCFESCTNITDVGVDAISQQLLKLTCLQNMELDFLGCNRLTNAGIVALATCMPPSLQVIKLNFALCSGITQVGADILAKSIPPAVTKLSVNFQGTQCLKSFDSIHDIRAKTRAFANILPRLPSKR